MKKLLTLAVAAALTMSVAVASAATTLQLSEVHAEGYPTTLADQEFARLVEERTGRPHQDEVYSGRQLYGEETGRHRSDAAGDLAFSRVSRLPGVQLRACDERHPDAVSVQEC